MVVERMAMEDSLKKLYIEPSSRCGLDCVMCFRKSWFDEEFSDMQEDTLERVLAEMPGSVETVFFGGMGEPLCNPGIVRWVALAKSTGRRVELQSNGWLLDEGASCSLLESGLDGLWVSLDSFDRSGYEAIRNRSEYARILENLRAFNRQRERRMLESREDAKKVRRMYRTEDGPAGSLGPPAALPEGCRLGVAFVAMKENLGELTRFPGFAAEFGVDALNVSNAIPSTIHAEGDSLYGSLVYAGIKSRTEKTRRVSVNLPLFDFRDEAAASMLSGFLSAPSLDVNLCGERLVRKDRRCDFVEGGKAFIRHDGSVAPCMALLHNSRTYQNGFERTVRRHSFGNVRDSSIADIWNSSDYADFRNRVREFSFSPCIRCGLCEYGIENNEDCFGSPGPTCGACLWSEGVFSCP